MFISDDDPFRLTDYEQSFKINVINENSTLHSRNKSKQRATINFDSSFTDFTQTISKTLVKGTYPQNIALFNPFCPICAKFVNKTDNYTLCLIRNYQIHLIHDQCLLSNPTFQMNLVAQEEDNLNILKKGSVEENKGDEQNFKILALQYRQFLIEITFYHPISQKKFGKIQKKYKSPKQSGFISLKLTDLSIDDEYSPNMIVLPLTDYQLEIGIHEIGEQKKQKIKKYVNFKKLSSASSNEIVFGNQQIQFGVTLLHSQSQKTATLQKMNYKYTYPVGKLSMIIVQSVKIQLPEDFKQSDSEQYDQIMQSRSTKILQYLEIDSKLQDFKSQTSKRSSQYNHSVEENFFKNSQQSNPAQKRKKSTFKAQCDDCDRVNLDKLIKTDTLKDFVKNNTQSRSFQSYLQKATTQEIDRIIDHMKQHFVDLMKHQYGNYMMQKLFSVCSLQRRLHILQILIPSLSDIVMNKQGTHAFQDFLSFFTNNQEHIIVLNKIRQNFFQLCVHNNATHFVQKIIKQFPMELLNEFYYYCVQNLYQFGCDKNGMCVLKHMIKKLKEITQKSLEIINNSQAQKAAQQYKKWFVQATLYNLDAIIGDMYGNYVVQFNFELFEPALISSLTDSILMKLPQYSLSKYSTNVVFKCLSVYWVDRKEYVSSVLKEVFQPYLILEMYKNKDGNKVLLEIMEKYEGYQIWNRLYNVLITTEPTRFYHDRWGICLGSRSGNIGGNWSSFSDALQKMSQKRKNNKFV